MLWRGVALAFAAGLLTAPAMAADTVKPAPFVPAPVAVAPVDYFSGLYAGLHGGWGWSDATSKYVDSSFDPPYCGGSYYYGCPVDVDPAGAFVGGQIGVNHVLSGGLLLGIQGTTRSPAWKTTARARLTHSPTRTPRPRR